MTTTTQAKPSISAGLHGVTHMFSGLHLGGFHQWTLLGSVTLGLFIIGGAIYTWLKDRVNRGGEGTKAGLNYVVGPQGSGKSMFGVGELVEGLTSWQYVVTNVELWPVGSTKLPEGWAVALAKHKWPRKGADEVRALARRLEGFYVYETDLRVAMRYRPPCAICGGNVRQCGHSGPEQEGRAKFVWDETHNDLNNRDYQGHGIDREQKEIERERRRLIIRFGTQLRKLGYCGFLLSQHHENTDAQLRRACNHIIKLQNQRNAEGAFLARLLPRRWTVFLAYWYPAHLATGQSEHTVKPIRFDRYFLPWHRCLYDSWAVYAGIDALDDEDAPILLPAGGRNAEGGAPRSGVPAAPASASLHHPVPAALLAVAPGGDREAVVGDGAAASQQRTSHATDAPRDAFPALGTG